MRLIFLLLFIFCCGLVDRAVAESLAINNRIPDQYLPGTLHRSWSVREIGDRLEGQWDLWAGVAWTNTYLSETNYLVDYETRSFYLQGQYQIDSDSSLGVMIPIVWRGGGSLDSFIQSWHDFFGLPNADRDRVANGLYSVAGLNEDGSAFSLDQDGTGLGSIELEYTSALSKGDLSLAVEYGVSLPTASSGYGHSGFDLSLGFLADWESLRAGLAYFYYSDDDVNQLKFRSHHAEAFLGYELPLTEDLHAGLSLIGSTDKFDIAGHPDYMGYLDIALGYRLNQKLTLQALVREDIAGNDGEADVTMYLGVKFRNI